MEHYILKGVTDALFLVVQNFHNRTANKNIAGVAPRGVVYTLRSVLRGLAMSSLAHFTVYLYASTWLFLCLFFAEAVEGPERRTGRCKHPRFFFCS